MENEANKAELKEKKSGAGKKKGNKPSANPVGRNRAKSTVLANFQKNTMSNKLNEQDSKKPIQTGVTQDRFKNLLSMFDKKPAEEMKKEDEKPSYGANVKMNSDRFSMFNKNNENTTDKKDNNVLTGLDPSKPRLSIKERMEKLMQSKEESKPVQKIDPILERLRENRNEGDEEFDEDEDSYDDELSGEDNLDGSEGEKNDDLDKTESLSDEKKESKEEEENNEVEVLKSIGSNEEENQPEGDKEVLNAKVTEKDVHKDDIVKPKELQGDKEDLNKSEELDD
jgi:hypothetical protein